MGIYVGAGGVKTVNSLYVGAGGVKTVTAVYVGAGGTYKVWPDNLDLLTSSGGYTQDYPSTIWGGTDSTGGVSTVYDSTSSYYRISEDNYEKALPQYRSTNLYEGDNIDNYNTISIEYYQYSSEGDDKNYVTFEIVFFSSSDRSTTNGITYRRRIQLFYEYLGPDKATYTASISSTQKSNFITYKASYPYVRFGISIYNSMRYSESGEDYRIYVRGGRVSSALLLE